MGGASNMPGSLVSVPGLMSSWDKVRTYTLLDPVERTVQSDPIVSIVNAWNFSYTAFDLMQSLVNLHEEYRIDRITAVYKPLISEVIALDGQSLASTFVVPDLVYSFHPYSSIPPDYLTAAQRGNAKLVSSMERWACTFTPVPLLRGYESVTSDGFLNLGTQWIATAGGAVPHYGFYIVLQSNSDAGAPSPSFGGRVSFYYTISVRRPTLQP